MKKTSKTLSLMMALLLIFAMTSGMAFALEVVDIKPAEIPSGSVIVPSAPSGGSTVAPDTFVPGSGSCNHTNWCTPIYYQQTDGTWIAERSCMDCGAIQRSVGSARENIVKKATCTESGLKTVTAEFKDEWAGSREVHKEAIPALGHSVDTSRFLWVGDENFHYNVCDRCGERSNPQPHVWGEWQVIRNADSQNVGKAIQYCTVCGCNRTYEIPRKTPLTADGSMMGLWLSLAVVSLSAACSIALAKKKHN